MAATSAGTVVVPIYQTNSPEECHWVLSDSDACAIICENEEQLAKIVAIRDRLPNLRTVIVMDPPQGSSNGRAPTSRLSSAITLDEVRERGRSRSPQELEARRAAVRPRTPSRSSTPPARPARRRAACSPTATTARSST